MNYVRTYQPETPVYAARGSRVWHYAKAEPGTASEALQVRVALRAFPPSRVRAHGVNRIEARLIVMPPHKPETILIRTRRFDQDSRAAVRKLRADMARAAMAHCAELSAVAGVTIAFEPLKNADL